MKSPAVASGVKVEEKCGHVCGPHPGDLSDSHGASERRPSLEFYIFGEAILKPQTPRLAPLHSLSLPKDNHFAPVSTGASFCELGRKEKAPPIERGASRAAAPTEGSPQQFDLAVCECRDGKADKMRR